MQKNGSLLHRRRNKIDELTAERKKAEKLVKHWPTALWLISHNNGCRSYLSQLAYSLSAGKLITVH